MPRSVEISVMKISKLQPQLFEVILQLKYLEEDLSILFTKTYRQQVNSGEPMAQVGARFRAAMQQDIDDYKGGLGTYESNVANLLHTLEGSLTP